MVIHGVVNKEGMFIDIDWIQLNQWSIKKTEVYLMFVGDFGAKYFNNTGRWAKEWLWRKWWQTTTPVKKEMTKTSQELRMLSSVTINCHVTKIVINPGSQLSVL